MLKRFVIGFTLGFAAMYYYIYELDATVKDTSKMFESKASQYRGDKAHDAARDVLNR
jgi:hypothetical protein